MVKWTRPPRCRWHPAMANPLCDSAAVLLGIAGTGPDPETADTLPSLSPRTALVRAATKYRELMIGNL